MTVRVEQRLANDRADLRLVGPNDRRGTAPTKRVQVVVARGGVKLRSVIPMTGVDSKLCLDIAGAHAAEQYWPKQRRARTAFQTDTSVGDSDAARDRPVSAPEAPMSRTSW